MCRQSPAQAQRSHAGQAHIAARCAGRRIRHPVGVFVAELTQGHSNSRANAAAALAHGTSSTSSSNTQHLRASHGTMHAAPPLECRRKSEVLGRRQRPTPGLATACRLGLLALSRKGLLERNNLVYSAALQAGVPLVVCMGGGYGKPIEPSIDAHVDVYRVAAYRHWAAGAAPAAQQRGYPAAV
jgi:hypothetical protein